MENLALACVTCSLSKGARLSATDPESGLDVRVFNPRHDDWRDHFRWEGVTIAGITAIGRATAEALRMNRPRILEIRAEERVRGRLPII